MHRLRGGIASGELCKSTELSEEGLAQGSLTVDYSRLFLKLIICAMADPVNSVLRMFRAVRGGSRVACDSFV